MGTAGNLSTEEPGQLAAPLIYGRGKDAISLDPALIEDGESAKVTTNLYDTLVQFGIDNVDVEPGLAERWDISDDGLSYTFHLRPGVLFHDGTPLTAEAAVFSLGRLAFADHPHAPARRPYSFALAMVESLEPVDELTLRITLAEPYSPFLRNLAMFCCGIVSPAAVREYGDRFGEFPAGTGPFRFLTWTRDVEIVLERNPDWWAGSAKTERILFRPIPENTVRLDSLIRGDIHLMDGIDSADLDRIRETDGIELVSEPGMNVGYVGFACRRPPFNDARVRRALSMAVNKDVICEYLFRGTAQPAHGVLPPMLPGYDESAERLEYHPEAARALLDEAGFPDGFETELYTYVNPRPYNPQGARLAEAIQKDLAAVGVRANIFQLEWATYLQTMHDDEPPLFLLGWIGDNGDPDNFLYPLLVEGQNHARYRNDAFVTLVEQAQREQDETKRTALYRAAEDIAISDSPWIFLNHSFQIAAISADLDGLVLHPTGLTRLHRIQLVDQLGE